ncbi:Mrx12p TDEL_0E04040 [Torulaspora delbrueckii]|uniref:Uncharacterized protein n=1 Tax=Torulaspora delbrueckii TaxID=4950 RepID=G8ZVK3_TORDE|nr:hypothetical protein TDEL_0E04040 [Torulaspora delbrueckii]CCE92647.1 hypothetical protein TDEL_0E04040 [Torulaspora delbrueckii]
MSVLRRCFVTSRRVLNVADSPAAKTLASVLEHRCFNPLRHQLPSNIEIKNAYELSDSITKIINTVSDEEASAIHNKLIEELSRFEYGISQIHAKKLLEMGKPLSNKSVLEIVRNNPGRVSTSWELLLKYGAALSSVPDELLVSALDNILNSINGKEKEERVHNLSSIAQIITLLNNIEDKKCVGRESVEKLVAVMLEADATCALPLVLQQDDFPLEPFQQHIDVLTYYQTYVLSQFCPFEYLKKDERLLYHTVEVLGQEKAISLTEQEQEVADELSTHLANIANEIPSYWTIKTITSEASETATEFLKLFECIQADALDQKNFELAKKLLRIFGTFRDNTKISLELYHSYLLSYPKNATDLMFETFLALAYQGFRTSNKTLLKYAEVFIPQDIGQTMLAKVFRALILVNSRFDIDKSLNIYNDNIESLSKENDHGTNLSPSALVTEALILAYLSRNELDFARVIFDGCAREKTISGLTAIKRIKSYFALYGEAVENGRVEETMTHEILKLLRNL